MASAECVSGGPILRDLLSQDGENVVSLRSGAWYLGSMKLFWAFFLAILALTLAVACAPSGLDEKGLPRPNGELAAQAGISLDEMGEGYWVFSRKCMECHEARLPTGELKGQWHPVVTGASGNVGLSLSEEKAIANYVRAASHL